MEEDEDEQDTEVAEADPCLNCRLGFHGECQLVWDAFYAGNHTPTDCCCGGQDWLGGGGEGARVDARSGGSVAEERTPVDAYFEGFTGRKELSEYKNPLSSGRKEAVKVKPLSVGMVCEWAWLANAGGGAVAITGCPGYPAATVHHGPDKNTLHNTLDNLHRICTSCHNRWHGVNDPLYPPERPPADQPFLPLGECLDHDPITKATDEEVFAEEIRRRNESRKHGNLD